MSVRLYSTSSCGYCKMAKSYLHDRHIKFTEYNVGRDARKRDEMISKSGQSGVPVIDFNGKIIIGFNKNKIDRLIDKMGN